MSESHPRQGVTGSNPPPANKRSSDTRYRDRKWLHKKYWGEYLTEREISELCDCSKSTINRWLHKYDIPLRGKNWVPPHLKDAEWVRHKYLDKKWSTPQIADHIGVSTSAVRNALLNHGVEHRTVSESLSGEMSPEWKGGCVEYYGPSWKRQRRKARERDDNTCQLCGVTKDDIERNMSVHHITPFRRFGVENHKEANALDNLISLCPSCHQRTEQFAPLLPDTGGKQ